MLTFGDFTTKSGRSTPYFLNFGRVQTGRQVAALARLYAARIDEVFGRDVDVLFGPAYTTHIDPLVAHLRDRGGVLSDDDLARISAYRTQWRA